MRCQINNMGSREVGLQKMPGGTYVLGGFIHIKLDLVTYSGVE